MQAACEQTINSNSADAFPQAGKFYTLAGRNVYWEIIDGKNITSHYEEILKWSVQDVVGDVVFANYTYVNLYINPETGENHTITLDFDHKISTNRTILSVYWKWMSFTTAGFLKSDEQLLDENVGEHTHAWFPKNLSIGDYIPIGWEFDTTFLDDMLYEVVGEEVIQILDEKQDCWIARMPPSNTTDGERVRTDMFWVDKDTGIPLKIYSKERSLDDSRGFTDEYVLVHTNINLGPESAQPSSPTYTLTVPTTPGFPEAGKFYTWFFLDEGWYMSGATNVTYYSEGLFSWWVVSVTDNEARVYRIEWYNHVCEWEGDEELESVEIRYFSYRIGITTREILDATGAGVRFNMTSLTYDEPYDLTSELVGDIGEETYCWLPTNLYSGAYVNITWTFDGSRRLDNATFAVIDEEIVSALDDAQSCWVLYLPSTSSIDGTWNHSQTWYSDKDTGIPLRLVWEGWAVDGSSAFEHNIQLIDTNVDLEPYTYYLTITSTEGGTTNPLSGTYDYPAGSSLNVTAIPNLGYSFDYWLLDGEERTENPITIVMDTNHTLEAFFVGAPAIWSSDYMGNEKNTFTQMETVYVTVPSTGKNVTFYIVADQTIWNDGDSLTDISDGAEHLTLGPSPGIQVVPVWETSLTPGIYDIVEDTNINALYDAGLDRIDSVAEVGFAIEYAPPVASFTYSPLAPCTGETVIFNASASYDPDGNIASYKWDFGDGNITTVSHPVIAHTYVAVGTYMVNLTVIDNDGLTGTTIEYIVTNNLVRSVDDSIGDVEAGFVDIVRGSVLSNGTHLTVIIKLKELPHQLYFDDPETPDNYREYEWSLYIDVDGDPSTGDPSFDGTEVCIGIMHFKFPGSLPEYGTIVDKTQQNIWIYNSTTGHWLFEAYVTAIEDFSTNSLILVTPLQLIPWKNSLESSNLLFITSYYHDGKDLAYSLIVNDPPHQPQLSIAPSLAIEDDDDLIVTVIGPTPADPDGDEVTYTYRWLVDVGTGEFLDDELAGRGNHTGNMVPAADTTVGDIWRVEVTPLDEHGAVGLSAIATWQPVVPDATKPVADAGSDQTVNEDTLVTLDGSSSTDNVGITVYTWTFTDVTTKTLFGEKPTYTFNMPGVYTITLNVTDAAGNWAIDTVVITVLDVTKPVADAGPDQTVTEDALITFNGSQSSDNVDIIKYTWAFTDVTPKTLSGKNPTYLFTTPGTYIVTLTVEDAAGNNATHAFSLIVLLDTDGDGTPDVTDPDDDNDGINDYEDAFPLDPTETVDKDGDGIGNNADTDDDNDGVLDINDAFPLDPTESVDTDGDGVGDNADTDDDNDQVPDAQDAFPLDPLESLDTDGDGIGNNADTDDDDDGIPDVWEIDNGLDPLDAQDASLDTDNDGLINLQEYLQNKDPNVYDAEAIRKPRSVYIVAEVAVAAAAVTAVTAALASLGGLGQAFNSAISRLPIPDKLKDFLKLYGEKIFETVNKAKLEALEKAPFITKGELVALGISALVMTIVFGFVEANGLPRFLDPLVLVVVIPSTLLSVCMVSVAGEISEAFCARTCRVYRQFRLWMYGLGAFLISSLLFLFPFASPGITRYQSGEISDKTKGLIVLSKMLILLTLTIPFAGLFMLGFKIIGDAGLLMTLMTVCYSLVPLKPLVGKAVFDYRKEISLIALVSTGILFYSCIVNLLPHVTYLAVGVVSVFLSAITLNQLRKTHLK